MSHYFALKLYFLNMHLFVFFSLALYSLSTAFSKGASETLRGFSIDLIHRDSPESPFYNPSLTSSERITNAALRSISRLSQVAYSLSENKLPKPNVIPEDGEYLLKFYIGTPPVERLALAYTASDLIWVQCSSCIKCFPQDTPLYDPTNSSTFKNLSCNSQSCNLLPHGQHSCGVGGQCNYLTEYGDGTRFTVGVLGTESINFGSDDESQPITFSNTTFGCGLNNNIPTLAEGKVTGVVGLGAGPLSLVSQIGNQIGHKFSYCLNNFASTKMKFGTEAIITGNGVVTTPLIIKPSLPIYYFLNLEAIIVGPKMVQTGQTGGNIVIDTGAIMTMLDRSIYVNFVALLQEALGVKGTENLPFPFNFCLQYPPPDDMKFPSLSLQFTGANVPLRPRNLFIKIEDLNRLCLAVIPSPVSGISILGHIAQIDLHVGYDIEGKKVSFARAYNCTHPI